MRIGDTPAEGEAARIETRLERDPNWRALRQLDARLDAGDQPTAVPADKLRAALLAELSSNPDFIAFGRLKSAQGVAAASPTGARDPSGSREPLSTVESRHQGRSGLAQGPAVSGSMLASISAVAAQASTGPTGLDPGAETFRTRVKVKAKAGSLVRDDFTRIQGISRLLGARLNDLGVYRYEDIANWRGEDVRRVAAALDLGRAISRQGWIEQAAILAAARPQPVAEAAVASSPSPPAEAEAPSLIPPDAATDIVAPATASTGPTLSASVVDQPLAVTSDAPPFAQAQGTTDDAISQADAPAAKSHPFGARLDLIRGLTETDLHGLLAGGVTDVGMIAAWSATDVAHWRGKLGAGRRIEQDGWIAQAAMLASGTATAHARALLHGSAAAGIPLVLRPRRLRWPAQPELLQELAVARAVAKWQPGAAAARSGDGITHPEAEAPRIVEAEKPVTVLPVAIDPASEPAARIPTAMSAAAAAAHSAATSVARATPPASLSPASVSPRQRLGVRLDMSADEGLQARLARGSGAVISAGVAARAPLRTEPHRNGPNRTGPNSTGPNSTEPNSTGPNLAEPPQLRATHAPEADVTLAGVVVAPETATRAATAAPRTETVPPTATIEAVPAIAPARLPVVELATPLSAEPIETDPLALVARELAALADETGRNIGRPTATPAPTAATPKPSTAADRPVLTAAGARQQPILASEPDTPAMAPPPGRHPRDADRQTQEPDDADFERIDIGEADVVIVRADAGSGNASRRLPNLDALTRRLENRLTDDEDFDAASYAGYRAEIEEASVEIVSRARPQTTSEADDTPPVRAAVPRLEADMDKAGSGQATTSANTVMRRFLKALGGD